MSLDDPAIQQALTEASHNHDAPDTPQAVSSAPSTSIPGNPFASNDPAEIWSAPPTKAKGRAPNDPQGKTIPFDCENTDDLEKSLHDYLQDPDPQPPAEHTILEFRFGVDAAFLINKDHLRADRTQLEAQWATFSGKTGISVLNALAWREGDDNGKKEMKIKQRAIARACVESIAKVDHFKYTYNNEWLSKEDRASRLSFYCNDSLWNRMRTVNAGNGRSKGKRAMKPVYDCKGYIAVKFSATKQNLEVSYKHVPCHKTYEERAPPPRKGSKRRKWLELNDPQALERPSRTQKSKDPQPDTQHKRRKTANTTQLEAADHDETRAPLEQAIGADQNDSNNGILPNLNNNDTESNPTTSAAPSRSQPRFPISKHPDLRKNTSNSTSSIHAQMQHPHPISATSFPPLQSTPSSSSPRSSTSRRRGNLSKEKREAEILRARDEIEYMRQKLAEAERMVSYLETENQQMIQGGRRKEPRPPGHSWNVVTPGSWGSRGNGRQPQQEQRQEAFGLLVPDSGEG